MVEVRWSLEGSIQTDGMPNALTGTWGVKPVPAASAEEAAGRAATERTSRRAAQAIVTTRGVCRALR